MGSILSMTGAGNSGGVAGPSVIQQILDLNPVMWLRASDPASLISQGAASFDVSDLQFLQVDVASVAGYPFSASARFKFPDIVGSQVIWASGDKDSAAEHMYLWVNDSGEIFFTRVDVATGQSDTPTSALNIYDDDAFHVAVVVGTSSTNVRLYIDAESVLLDTTDIGINGHDRTVIGATADSSKINFTDGVIADVRVWDGTALSAAQAADVIAGTDPGPAETARWFLNDPAAPWLNSVGDVLLDLTGFGSVGEPTPVEGPEDTQAVEGSAIEQWLDKTVRDNDPVQITVIKRPELVELPWSDGSRPAVRFDGVDDFLIETVIDAAVVKPYEMFVVCRFIVPAGGFEVVLARSTNPRFSKRTTGNQIQIHDGSGNINDDAATANFEIFNLEFNDAASKIIRNSVTAITGGTTTLNWTNRIIVGSSSTAGLNLAEMDLLEVLFFPSGLLSAANKTLVLDYLRDENILYWGDVEDSGPVAHYSASSTDITTADNGSGNDVGDADAVGRLVDVSGHANHVIEATAAQKPTFDLLNSSFDDKSVLAFDGNDSLSVIDPAMDNGVGLTLGFVANITAASADHYLINKAGTYAVWMDSDGEIHVAIGTDDDVFATVLADVDAGIVAGTPFVLVVRYVTGSLKLFINGVQKGSEIVTVSGDVLDTAADVIIGASANDGSDGWDGEMAEGMVFDRGISDTEINNVFQPMGAKYGISVASV